MGSRENIWSELHTLARAIESQGCGPSERINKIAVAFDGLMPVSKKELKTDLAFVVSELQTLQAHLAVAARRQLTA